MAKLVRIACIALALALTAVLFAPPALAGVEQCVGGFPAYSQSISCGVLVTGCDSDWTNKSVTCSASKTFTEPGCTLHCARIEDNETTCRLEEFGVCDWSFKSEGNNRFEAVAVIFNPETGWYEYGTGGKTNVAVRIDKSPPVTTFSGPSGWIRAPSTTATLSCSDPLSGCAAYFYRVDGDSVQSQAYTGGDLDITVTGQGTLNVRYWSEDNAGNTESRQTATVQLDSTLPTTSDDAPGSTQGNDVTVTITCSDAHSGCDTLSYCVGEASCSLGSSADVSSGSAYVSVACPTDSLCAETLRHRVSDVAGNQSAIQNRLIIIDKTSEEPPPDDPEVGALETTISPDGVTWDNDGTGNGVPFVLTCTDNGAPCAASVVTFFEVRELDIPCGAGPYDDTGTNGRVTCPEGEICHKKVCFYSERAGDIEAPNNSAAFNIDKQPPTLSHDAPDNPVQAPITVTFSCDDATGSGCEQIAVRLNQGGFSSGNQVTLTEPGFYSVEGRVTDQAGNLAFQSALVTVNNEDGSLPPGGPPEELPPPGGNGGGGSGGGRGGGGGGLPPPKNPEPQVSPSPDFFIRVLPDTSGVEGEDFLFQAVLQTEQKGPFTYHWDFGDGESFEEEELDEIRHVYYLDLGEIEQTFSVRVRAKTETGLQKTATAEVTVVKSFFKAKLLQPASFYGNPQEKGSELDIELALLDLQDQLIELPSVTGLDANLVNTRVAFSSGDTSYTATVSTRTAYDSPASYLEVHATAVLDGIPRETSTHLPIYFKPVKLTATNPFEGREFYWGSPLDALRFTVRDPQNKRVLDLTGYAVLVPAQGPSYHTALSPVGAKYQAFFNYAFTKQDILNQPALVLKGFDSHRNRLEETFTVPTNHFNPLFNLLFINPKDQAYFYGQARPLQVNVQSLNQTFKEALVEHVTLSQERVSLVFDEEVNVYQRDFAFSGRESGLTTETIEVESAGVVDGVTYYDFEIREIPLSDALSITFLYPQEGFQEFNPERAGQIEAALTHTTGDPLTAPVVEATLAVGGRTHSVTLKKEGEEGHYIGTIEEEVREGIHTLRLELLGPFAGNEKTITAILHPPLLWLLLLLLLVLLAAGIAFYNYTKKKAGKALDTRTERRQRINDLLALTQKLKVEYLKRHITGEEYKERMTQVAMELREEEETAPPEKRAATALKRLVRAVVEAKDSAVWLIKNEFIPQTPPKLESLTEAKKGPPMFSAPGPAKPAPPVSVPTVPAPQAPEPAPQKIAPEVEMARELEAANTAYQRKEITLNEYKARLLALRDAVERRKMGNE